MGDCHPPRRWSWTVDHVGWAAGLIPDAQGVARDTICCPRVVKLAERGTLGILAERCSRER
jgi:hypothetical protein